VRGQVLSLAITLGVIFVLIYLMFLSMKIGLIAMAANLFPILVSFGVMGWMGIELSMGTCLIASIVVGLAVDDSIHYLARYRRAYLHTMDAEAAMRITLTQVGPPIAATSLAISAGFSILMFSNFSPTAVFGMLMMLAMASALSGGVVILPALLSKVSPITMEEMFRVRTGGDDLQKTVLLLKGMSRFQIHRVFKTGTIRRVQAGDCLFDEGDVADRLYVVISGVFDAVMAGSVPINNHRQAPRKRVNRLKVGDVIGEMGLLTSGLRCVSVFAVASGEVLALEQSHLERIRRLYPRTASRFFANLSAILTQKLITADTCLYETCNIDDDTGLLNRGAFLDRLTTEIQKAQRFGDSMTLCLLDIDGHGTLATRDPLAAEHVLGKIAKAMLDCFRSIDVCGRFDKGCLAVLLTRATETGKRSIRNRLERVFNGRFKESAGIHTP
jgi:diguanylate cyclase (GGDEF)-like protein